MTIKSNPSTVRIAWNDIAAEPFRIFFPAAVMAGIAGVALWPLYLWGMIGFYPGLVHARIMAFGFFGGFIFGFLGTALPRMLSSKPFRFWEVLLLALVHGAMIVAFSTGSGAVGDILFLLLIAGFLGCVLLRLPQRKDLPPPGFVLVGLALACAAMGAVISVIQNFSELNAGWITFQKLLSYQGFVLLPILGIGPFIFPRLLGRPNPPEFPESPRPHEGWVRAALLALATGLVVLLSFVVEALAWHRTGHAIRFLIISIYVLVQMPLHPPKPFNALGGSIPVALACVLAGFLGIAFFPFYRVALLHLTLMGGFAVVTFVVATRVVFGHGGHVGRLSGRNRWLALAAGLIWLGMATRISGDLWPKLMASHYSYGAFLWIAGVLLWSAYVLPKVLTVESEK